MVYIDSINCHQSSPIYYNYSYIGRASTSSCWNDWWVRQIITMATWFRCSWKQGFPVVPHTWSMEECGREHTHTHTHTHPPTHTHHPQTYFCKYPNTSYTKWAEEDKNGQIAFHPCITRFNRDILKQKWIKGCFSRVHKTYSGSPTLQIALQIHNACGNPLGEKQRLHK